MARIRSIKPSFFRDLVIGGLPIPTRLTYIGLWTYVDDEGRGVDDARLIKAELWPLDDRYTVKKVQVDIAKLVEAGRVCRYQANSERYLHVVYFGKHQRVNRPYKSVIPPCALTEHSVNDHGTITAGLGVREKERKGRGERSVNERPPPLGKTDLAHTTTALAERKAADLALAEACGECDHGWRPLHDGLGSVRRCDCQNGGHP